MKNGEFLQWINDQIEAKYKRDLQNAHDPKRVKRMSLRELGSAIDMSHSNISRLTQRGKPGDKLIKALAQYFNVPEIELFRVAGRVKGVDPRDENAAIILSLAEQMDLADQETYIRIGQALIGKEKKSDS